MSNNTVEPPNGVVELFNRMIKDSDHTALESSHKVKLHGRMAEHFDHTLLLSSHDFSPASLEISGLQTMQPSSGNVRFYRSTASRDKSAE